MRFLIVDYYYPRFLESFYRTRDHREDISYDALRNELRGALFGETSFEVDALRSLGHEADDVIINAYPVRKAWADEHGVSIGEERRWQVHRRRGLVPWVARRGDGSVGWTTRQAAVPWLSKAADASWMWTTLLAQVRVYRPDVVHVACMDVIPESIVRELAGLASLVVGQVAAALPASYSYRHYGLVVSSIPDLVEGFHRHGVASEWLPLAFEPSLRRVIPQVERDIPVSFVGSFSIAHPRRAEVVEAVARVAPLQTWTPGSRGIPKGSSIARTIQGQAYGAEMYRILARSLVTLNTHAAVAGNAANNLRLYEATGMGALLVTEERANLDSLFEEGREVVTYRTPHEAGERVRYFLDHPDEARLIAAAGQTRTLRDHTWVNRMQRLCDFIQPRLSA